jgi:hypothetical protein
MGKGAKAPPQQTEQNITQSSLPKYFEPYAIDMMKRAESESKREYTPFEGQRIADQDASTDAAQTKANLIATSDIPGYDTANYGLQAAYDRNVEGMGYKSQDFDSGQAQKYMSPYLQNVLNVQKDQAMMDFQRGQAGRDATAVGEGAFGGSRGAVQQGIANEALQRDMQRIQAEGQQKAFESAQQQFGADRTSQMEAEKMGMAGAGALTGQSAQMAELGQKARAGDIESAQMLEKIAKDRYAREQAGLDLSYEDFIRQRDKPREDLTFLSSILRGVPVSPSTETTKLQNRDPFQDLLGTGIAGLGLYKGITG